MYLFGSFEWTIEEAITKLYRGDGVFVDVGAHIGSISLHAAEIARKHGGKVYSFEPNVEVRNLLRRNIASNDLGDTVSVFDVALSDRDDIKSLFTPDRSNSGTTTLVARSDGPPITCRRLDDLVHDEKVQMMKIDVEGHEEQVLRGAFEVIRRNRPVIIMEVNDPVTLQILEELDYSFFVPSIELGTFTLVAMKNVGELARPGSASNVVAIPGEATNQAR